MADKELATILSSGEISNIYLGGTDSEDRAATHGDIALSMLSVGCNTALSAQSLVSGVPEKLEWIESANINQGSDMTYSAEDDKITVLTAGVYSFGGTVSLIATNNDEVVITLYVNGSPTPFKSFLRSVSSTYPMTFVYHGTTSFNANDEIELYIESSGTSITVQVSCVSLEKLT